MKRAFFGQNLQKNETEHGKSKNHFTHLYLILLLHKIKIISKKFAFLAARPIFVSPFFTILD
jgi:hypothetical protein